MQQRQEKYELMIQGWESREKSKLVKFVAQLMDYEFDKLKAISAVATGWVVNMEVDLVGQCNKLEERATPTFLMVDGQGTSPVLE